MKPLLQGRIRMELRKFQEIQVIRAIVKPLLVHFIIDWSFPCWNPGSDSKNSAEILKADNHKAQLALWEVVAGMVDIKDSLAYQLAMNIVTCRHAAQLYVSQIRTSSLYLNKYKSFELSLSQCSLCISSLINISWLISMLRQQKLSAEILKADKHKAKLELWEVVAGIADITIP